MKLFSQFSTCKWHLIVQSTWMDDYTPDIFRTFLLTLRCSCVQGPDKCHVAGRIRASLRNGTPTTTVAPDCQRILSSVCPCRHPLRSQHYAGLPHNDLVPIRSRTRREGHLRIIHHPTFLFIMCERSSLLRSFYVSPGVRRNRVRVEIYTGLREHLRCNPWLRPVCNFQKHKGGIVAVQQCLAMVW